LGVASEHVLYNRTEADKKENYWSGYSKGISASSGIFVGDVEIHGIPEILGLGYVCGY
jgi:hypothetical protein